jgi:hypothetical protein
MTMRGKTLVLVPLLTASILGAAAAVADEDVAASISKVKPPPTVWLRGQLDIEKLKESNPNHALRAQRIMADAEEICKPGPEQVHYARWASEDVSCQGMFLRTSYPAKREIGFTLDGVRYVALVEVKNGGGEIRQVPDVLDPSHPLQ